MVPESFAPTDRLEIVFGKEAADNYINNLRHGDDYSPLPPSQIFKKFKGELGSSLMEFRSLMLIWQA